jgi:hypothetical protein
MVLERIRPFRLVERGGAGLACDADGIGLSSIALASLDAEAGGGRRYVVRSASELSTILATAYGRQRHDVVQRCHRGLRRAVSALEAQDLALAGIEAVMLALPELDADAIAKLARLADLEKGGDSSGNEPRLPAGQPGGGEWTTGGGTGTVAHSPPPRPSTVPHRRSDRTTGDAPPGRLPQQNANASKPSGAGRPVSRVPSVPAGRSAPPKPASADPVATLVDVSNSVASTLVHAANWLQQPATYVPIAPEIAAGEAGFPMGAAVEETTDPNAFRDWRPVSNLEIGADAASAVSIVAPAARVVAEETDWTGRVMRFNSFAELKQYLGSPGPGNQWHHIVEQTPKNLRTFGAQEIQSTDNVIAVPKSVHVGKNSISALYSSKPDYTKGLTVRRWLSTQSFLAQRQFGVRILKSRRQWK